MFKIRSAKIGTVLVDETDGMSIDAVRRLVARGLIFTTEFSVDGKDHTGNVIAASYDAAEDVLSERALGERIIGRLV